MTYPFPLGARGCEATDEDIDCDQAATYVVTVEEDDDNESRAIESRHSCGWHLPSAVDWAGILATPFTGDADDAYRTLHERRITVARSGDNPETEDNPAVRFDSTILA